MELPCSGSRRSARMVTAVSSFSFPQNHKTAASRIKESRERSRIRVAVRKSRVEGENNKKVFEAKDIKKKKDVGKKSKLKKKVLEKKDIKKKKDGGKKSKLEKKENVETKKKVVKKVKKPPKATLKVKFNWKK